MAILSTLLDSTTQPISPSLNKDYAITVMLFCNLNTPDLLNPILGKQLVDIHVVPSGGTPTDTNKIANAIPIDAGDTFTFNTERLVLGPNDRIHASASFAGEVSATISYIVI